jgi:mannose-6-phosphate isomerase
MVLLEGVVQHYEWGGYTFIPSLLGKAGKARKPHAEYWLGAHPKAPSLARVGGRRVPLTELAPGFPFLFKVLDAREMLSIQAHPTIPQARRGFAAEEAAGIPLNAPNRNYRDQNHKPEVHVALTPFWMLHGFRPWEEIAGFVEAIPEFRPLRRIASLKTLVRRVLTMDAPESVLAPLLTRLREEAPSRRDDPGYWVLRAAATYPDAARDRGLFFLYLLNLVSLRPGEGTYQPAGVLHAYLEGSNVELMANSDNVLRAGLTPKHIDPTELLRTISFEMGFPPILRGEAAGRGVRAYRTPSTEFELSRIQVAAGTRRKREAHGPAILLVTEGAATVGGIPLQKGRSVFAKDESYAIESSDSPVVLFEAAVPA